MYCIMSRLTCLPNYITRPHGCTQNCKSTARAGCTGCVPWSFCSERRNAATPSPALGLLTSAALFALSSKVPPRLNLYIYLLIGCGCKLSLDPSDAASAMGVRIGTSRPNATRVACRPRRADNVIERRRTTWRIVRWRPRRAVRAPAAQPPPQADLS